MGGWATAVGGAWKDAPIEGFSRWKSLRSPLVATAWAVPCSVLTDDWGTLGLVSSGLAVATIETYKTFMTGDQPPGKFAGRVRRHHLPATRAMLAKLHAAAWSLLALGALWSALHPIAAGPSTASPWTAGGVTSLAVAGIATLALFISLRAGRTLAQTPVLPGDDAAGEARHQPDLSASSP